MMTSMPGASSPGEHDAGVDDDHVVGVFDDEHVLADLAETAEGNDAEIRLAHEPSSLSTRRRRGRLEEAELLRLLLRRLDLGGLRDELRNLLEVGFYRGAKRLLVERRRGMVHGHDGPPLHAAGLAVGLADGGSGKETLQRVPSQASR